MPELIDVINNSGIDLLNDIRANLGASGTNATGRTSNSLRIEVTQSGTKTKLTLYGRPFFTTVEEGRKPTPNKKPSREFIENLRPWAESRGIPQSAVWAIATHINQRGTDLWLAGGRQDIYTDPINGFVDTVGQAILDSEAENLIFKVKQMKW
jgi:hypothetical protein